MNLTRRDVLRGLAALGLVAPTAALYQAATAQAQGFPTPPMWWDRDPRATLRRDAVCLYTFRNASNLGLDSSLNSNNLTNNNSVTAATGAKPGGQGAAFVGASSQSLTLASNSVVAMGDVSQAWACWFSYTSTASTQALIAKEGDGALLDYMLAIGTLVNGRPAWTLFTSGPTANTLDWPTALAVNTWHLVICSYDAATRRQSLRVDNAAPQRTTLGGALIAATAAEFSLGRRNRGSGSLYLTGTLGLVLGLKRLFTPTEIAWLWNTGAGRTF